jgi:hypothetical protein
MASVALVETGEKIRVSNATVAEKSQERLFEWRILRRMKGEGIEDARQ